MALFDTDFVAADGTFAEAFGDTVSYHRGADSVATMTAEINQIDHEVMDAEGFKTTIRSCDFVVDAEDLVILGDAIDPRPGDRIKHTVGTEVRIYTVMHLLDRDCYEWTDPSKTQIVIHTKYTGVES